MMRSTCCLLLGNYLPDVSWPFVTVLLEKECFRKMALNQKPTRKAMMDAEKLALKLPFAAGDRSCLSWCDFLREEVDFQI